MSLNSIMNIATSGMATAQSQLRVISDNASNVNTPGYIRKIADQQSLTTQGAGAGVEVARVRLATDRFLQAASLSANGEAARQTARYELYDRVQLQFGDPGGDGFFSQIDSVFSAFSNSVDDPVSGARRQDSLYKTQQLFDEAKRISGEIQSVREEADGRILTAVETVNGLLAEIEKLNLQIARATVSNQDSTGAETMQLNLIDQLSSLMNVQISPRSIGGVTLRTGSGQLLAGDGHATLSFQRAGSVHAGTVFNDVYVVEPRGQRSSLTDTLKSGEIKGLLEARDQDAPAAAERLAELMSKMADELNRAHNASASAPPPSALTGRNVGQSLETALTGFNGRTTIAITDASGVIQNRAEIVFTGGTMTINGVAATPSNFLTILNGQIGAANASFVDGVLKIDAGSGGVAIADDPVMPSNKAGRGFSHYFGLNDLVTTDQVSNYDLGLTGTSQHGFTPGETMTFRFINANGSRQRDLQFAVPAGVGTMDELLTALNQTVGGLGSMGVFSLSPTGGVAFTAHDTPAPTMVVVNDQTRQVPSGVSMSDLFGLGGGIRSARADGFTIRADIQKQPALLALGRLDAGAAVGAVAVTSGDSRGAQLLADAGERNTTFAAAGGAAGGSLSLSRYASELSGDIGGKSQIAKNRADSANALAKEATARRTSHEGVNLDEELVLMTTYQQAFNASARLIQAAKDMYDVLVGMV